jgi:hypothetical protein
MNSFRQSEQAVGQRQHRLQLFLGDDGPRPYTFFANAAADLFREQLDLRLQQAARFRQSELRVPLQRVRSLECFFHQGLEALSIDQLAILFVRLLTCERIHPAPLGELPSSQGLVDCLCRELLDAEVGMNGRRIFFHAVQQRSTDLLEPLVPQLIVQLLEMPCARFPQPERIER